jgi:hypothetical protein
MKFVEGARLGGGDFVMERCLKEESSACCQKLYGFFSSTSSTS